MVMIAMAKQQAQSWMVLHGQGKVEMADKADPFVMLLALSDLAQVLGAGRLPHSFSNRYRDPQAAAMLMNAAEEQFDRVAQMPFEGMNAKELATAVQGLVWFAAATSDRGRKLQALKLVKDLGERLMGAPAGTAAEKGYLMRGLIEAYRATKAAKFKRAAAAAFQALAAEYRPDFGIFESQNTYTIDDVAAIVGGLNAVKLFDGVDRAKVEEIFSGFFESAVDLSGLQQAVPAVAEAKGKFEQFEPPIYYGYPTIPSPRQADGPFGLAPVFAGSVTFDPGQGKWTGIDRGFDTAGAMHAANEFIWLHHDEVNGFPEVALPRGGPSLVLILALLGLVALAALLLLKP